MKGGASPQPSDSGEGQSGRESIDNSLTQKCWYESHDSWYVPERAQAWIRTYGDGETEGYIVDLRRRCILD